jgi:predicted PurR-regulated permease PerM
MGSKSSVTSLQQVLAILGSVVLIVASLSLAQKILIPLVMAVLFTFVLAPLVAALQRRRIKKVWAAITVVLLALAVVGGLVWVVTSQVQALADEIPKHQATIAQKIARLRQESTGALNRFWQMIQEINQEVDRAGKEPESGMPEEPPPLVVKSESSFVLPWVTGLAAPLVEGLLNAALITMLVTFMLIQREDLRNRVLRLIGHGRLTSTTKALDDAAQRISRFLFMQSIINLFFGLLATTGLFFIGMPFALLWGFLAGCLRFIPYLGIWIALLFPIAYSVAIFPGWLQPALVIGLFVILELITANVLEPILLGHSTGISPIALLVAAAFWSWLWGPLGLILATPLTTCLVVLGKYVPHLEFLDTLLGDKPALQTDISFYQRLLARDQDEAVELLEEYVQTHAPETLYDEVLLPALVYVKRDQERGLLDDQDQAFIFRATREILEQLPFESGGKPRAGTPMAPSRVLVFLCPARDQADEVAAEMFRDMLEPSGCQIEVLSDRVLSAEMVNRVEQESPDLICIASLPPGGLAQARYLCKRLRARVPGVKVAVGRWGQRDNIKQTRERLQASGADYVATSMMESQQQILALKPVLEANSTTAENGRPGQPALSRSARASH